MPRLRRAALVAFVTALAAGSVIGGSTVSRFIVYDQQQYKPDQLHLAARSPVARQAAALN